MTSPVQSRAIDITERLAERSAASRMAYLEHVDNAARRGPHRGGASCSPAFGA